MFSFTVTQAFEHSFLDLILCSNSWDIMILSVIFLPGTKAASDSEISSPKHSLSHRTRILEMILTLITLIIFLAFLVFVAPYGRTMCFCLQILTMYCNFFDAKIFLHFDMRCLDPVLVVGNLR